MRVKRNLKGNYPSFSFPCLLLPRNEENSFFHLPCTSFNCTIIVCSSNHLTMKDLMLEFDCNYANTMLMEDLMLEFDCNYVNTMF